MRGQLDVGGLERLGGRIDLLDGIIDAASEQRVADHDHAVHLVAVADASDAVVGSGGDIPTRDDSVVRSSVQRVSVAVDSQDGYRFVMSLSTTTTNVSFR